MDVAIYTRWVYMAPIKYYKINHIYHGRCNIYPLGIYGAYKI
jgi:hypothetical protein